jgi:Collagen triple helix repeat (20 copies)
MISGRSLGFVAMVFCVAVGCGGAGDVGPAGPAGAVGPAGPAGTQGPMGMPGDTGPAGPVGPAGPQGEPGSAAAKGDPGAPGPMGAPGAMGAQGVAGPVGPTGAQGPMGIPGAMGAQGASGPAGPAGADGGVVAGSIGCVGPLADTSLSVNYQAVQLSGGAVFATASVISPDIQASGAQIFSATQNGYIDAPVVIFFDVQGAANSGWWRISLNRTTLVVTVIYNDSDLGGSGTRTWTSSPSICQSF